MVQSILRTLKASSMVVAGHGLREGIALAACAEGLPTVPTVREAALRRAVGLFATEREHAASRRLEIVECLAAACGLTDPEVLGALRAAAELLDLGRSIDYYSRHRHTEQIVLERGLAGFSHREHALINALVRQADREKFDIDAYRPLLSGSDRDEVSRASTLLAAADLIEQHTPPEAIAEVTARLDDKVLDHRGTVQRALERLYARGALPAHPRHSPARRRRRRCLARSRYRGARPHCSRPCTTPRPRVVCVPHHSRGRGTAP